MYGANHGSSHFNLDLQTGAFLQLILTLTAITSRMAILLTEIGPVVANSWAAFYRLTETLSVSVGHLSTLFGVANITPSPMNRVPLQNV